VLSNPPEKTSLVSDKLWLAGGWRGGLSFHQNRRALQRKCAILLVIPAGARVGWDAHCEVAGRICNGRRASSHHGRADLWPAASVSVIGSGSEARAIAVNEQAHRLSWTRAMGLSMDSGQHHTPGSPLPIAIWQGWQSNSYRPGAGGQPMGWTFFAQ